MVVGNMSCLMATFVYVNNVSWWLSQEFWADVEVSDKMTLKCLALSCNCNKSSTWSHFIWIILVEDLFRIMTVTVQFQESWPQFSMKKAVGNEWIDNWSIVTNHTAPKKLFHPSVWTWPTFLSGSMFYKYSLSWAVWFV